MSIGGCASWLQLRSSHLPLGTSRPACLDSSQHLSRAAVQINWHYKMANTTGLCVALIGSYGQHLPQSSRASSAAAKEGAEAAAPAPVAAVVVERGRWSGLPVVRASGTL